MLRNIILLLFSLLLSFSNLLLSQDVDVKTEINPFTIDTPVTIDFKKEEASEFVEIKDKKRKKNVFFGIKTKKRFTQNGRGKRITLELFHVLKNPTELSPFVEDIYWFDYRRRQIRIGGKIDQHFGAILHGEYEKIYNGNTIESGIFYNGMKHGRWMYYDKNGLLTNKQKYLYGWSKESLISFHDKEKEKIREVIPIEYEEKHGTYYYFFENGKIGVKGKYKWDKRIDDWTEYYSTGKRKKVIRYPKEPFNESLPFTLKEWDEKGRLVYENKSY